MPLALSNSTPARAPLAGGPRYIVVGPNGSHEWVVKDNRGAIGAVFRAADVALRFARREAQVLGCGVIVARGPVDLDCLKG